MDHSKGRSPKRQKTSGADSSIVPTENLRNVVTSIVNETEAIDLHTHLFPSSHEDLFVYGIDELLTYHYLIAEFFAVAHEDVTPKSFYEMSTRDQANIIWKELFIKRSPLSEACRGVLTTLNELGLRDLVTKRDLDGVRAWFEKQTPETYEKLVFRLSKIKYAVMTNIPFETKEAKHWMMRKPVSKFYKSALRLDPFLKNDWNTVCETLKKQGYPLTIKGARDWTRYWCDKINPVYLMASTPFDFTYPEKKSSMSCPSNSLLKDVMLHIAKERNLAVALKLGAKRGVNPSLRTAGDGVVPVDLSSLERLCKDFPEIRFCVTVLSRVNQHQLCVLAQKFRNLHLYGCWWFLNNPSMIQEITSMRLEMLGLSFTAQHSDCRVIDQLIYKWRHSRTIIADVLTEYYEKLCRNSGWIVTKSEIERDVWELMGGSFEAFLNGYK